MSFQENNKLSKNWNAMAVANLVVHVKPNLVAINLGKIDDRPWSKYT